MDYDGFDWDGGNTLKCQKHGVSIAEIESMFRFHPLVGPDPNASSELRYRAIGRTHAGRPVFVVFTWRATSARRLLRPLSARYMHRKEIDAYDAKIPRV